MTDLERINTIVVLELEVEVLESRVKEHATGHIITAIGVLKSRIDELRKEEMKEKYGRAVETIHVGLEELG